MMKPTAVAMATVVAVLISGVSWAGQGDKSGTLICNPINPPTDNPSGAVTIKWERDRITFIDEKSSYENAEHYKYDSDTELWTNYCLPVYGPTGRVATPEERTELVKNKCANVGSLSFFNGTTMVLYSTEFKCRKVEQLRLD